MVVLVVVAALALVNTLEIPVDDFADTDLRKTTVTAGHRSEHALIKYLYLEHFEYRTLM